MDQDQRAAPARGDEVRPDHRLADARWRDEDASVVGHESARGLLLHRRKRPLEAEVERRPACTLVLDVQADAVAAQQLLDLGPATPRERHVLRQILRAVDHARCHRGGQAHALLLVELGVLESGEALDLVEERRRESGLLDEKSLREHRRDARR
jgi:hypothetical protein